MSQQLFLLQQPAWDGPVKTDSVPRPVGLQFRFKLAGRAGTQRGVATGKVEVHIELMGQPQAGQFQARRQRIPEAIIRF
ncbi:hypothetical protein BEN49_20275 [Hymenobacter coccineus]|uniref:Uncharacterized protein n=1 Tax=Hymenobacter coccineus TaxID=1908235 RepID=A0A1G1TKA3_9BACT|nr:hypothetical protein BEN49_20275 [Hymenobacter coccineus]